MKYAPGAPNFDAKDTEALRRFVVEELRKVAGALGEVESLLLEVRHVSPTKPRDGMIVLADGTDWNPGSGAGFYGRSNGAWVLLG